MLRVERYKPPYASCWNEYVARAKNGVFLFDRGYMDYHADRFQDHSLLFFLEDTLVAVLPASVRDEVLTSHGGLTFGGVLCDSRMRTETMIQVFAVMREQLRHDGIRRIIYKAVPHIYHRIPAEEDLYALFVAGARLIRRDVSSTIQQGARLPMTKGRRWSTRRGRKQGIEVRLSQNYQSFMAIEEENLRKKYGVRPTHTAEEMVLLADRFPDNIRLHTAHRNDRLLAGVIIYRSNRVAHAQYIASTEEGRELGAVDVIMEQLIDDVYSDVPYFDFGISTEDGGRRLNPGLIENKESYGARAIAYDFYDLEVGG